MRKRSGKPSLRATLRSRAAEKIAIDNPPSGAVLWWSTAARSVIESLSELHRREFDAISDFIAISPEPIQGLSTVIEIQFFGATRFRYFDNAFPFEIIYRIDDLGDIQTDLVLRAFVN